MPLTLDQRVEAIMEAIDRDPILIAPTWQNYRVAVVTAIRSLLREIDALEQSAHPSAGVPDA